MRSKHKRSAGKTRGHKVEKRDHVSLLKHASSQHHGKWQGTNENKHSEYQEWQGHQNSDSEGKREDTQINEEVEQIRDEEDTKESIHPGPFQNLSHMSEQQTTAGNQTTDKTEIEAEELSP